MRVRLFSAFQTYAATCNQKGIKTYTCSVCKDTKTEEIATNSSSHTGETVVKNAVAATCSVATSLGSFINMAFPDFFFLKVTILLLTATTLFHIVFGVDYPLAIFRTCRENQISFLLVAGLY